MKIYNFGSLNIDHVYDVHNIVKVGETISSFSYEKLIGGKGLNQSIALAKAGAEVVHLGCVGEEGRFLLDFLKENQVNVDFIEIVDTPTGHAIIQLDAMGNNSIVLYPGANHQVSRMYIDQMFNMISNEDLILLQNEISNLEYIIDRAYELEIPVALNLAPVTEAALALDFSKITHLLVNETEGEALIGEQDHHSIGTKLCQKYPNLEVVLTLGENGSIYFHQNQIIEQGIYKAKVVDTTAAGDTFTGYYLASRLLSKDIKQALASAACASSLAVEVKGAANSIPIQSLVIARLDETK